MNIDEASRASGVSQRMIRHYEHVGVIPPPLRRESGHRIYGDDDVARLRFAAAARAVGFELPEIGAMLRLWSGDAGEVSTWRQALSRKSKLLRELRAMIDDVADPRGSAPAFPGDRRP